ASASPPPPLPRTPSPAPHPVPATTPAAPPVICQLVDDLQSDPARPAQRSRTAFSRRRSASLALRMARAMTGAVTAEKPDGSPRLRRRILVAPSGVSSQV